MFDGEHTIGKMVYLNRHESEANKDLTLTFSDGSTQTVTVAQDSTSEHDLTPVTTSFVKIDVTSHYTKVNNGAHRIDFWTPEEAPSCKSCAAGKYRSTGGAHCEACSGQQMPTAAQDACEECDAGKYADDGVSEVVPVASCDASCA